MICQPALDVTRNGVYSGDMEETHMSDLIKASGEPCSICTMEFPHATPNPAVADECRPGLGWVYVCGHHQTKALPANHIAERAIDPAFAAQLTAIMMHGPVKKEEPKERVRKPRAEPCGLGFFS